MEDASLEVEEAILLALRSSPGSRAGELAEAVGLPRTNFGRRMKKRLRQPLERLKAAGLIEEHRGRYEITDEGRRSLSEHFLAQGSR